MNLASPYYIYNTSLVPRRRPNQPFNVDGFSVYVILNATRARVGWVWLALAQYRRGGGAGPCPHERHGVEVKESSGDLRTGAL